MKEESGQCENNEENENNERNNEEMKESNKIMKMKSNDILY